QVFEDEGEPDELATEELLAALLALEESPWRDWWGVVDRATGEVEPGKGAARKLAALLRPLKIRSRKIGPETARRNGYLRAHLAAQWGRYLPSNPCTPPPDPDRPDIPHAEAKNQPSQPGQKGQGCPGMGAPQTRMAKPNVRNVRVEPGGTGISAPDEPCGPW